MATRNLLVRAGFDATGMRNGVRQGNRYLNQFGTNANNAMSNLNNTIGSTMGKIGKLIAGAFVVGKMVQFGKECVELGSNLSEIQNVVDVTFGSMAEDINEFAATAITQLGLSETSAKKYASTMGAILKSSGIGTKDALEMSKAITTLSADMASFYNLDSDTAFEKIRSGLTGETEPLKQLGINMSVANLEAYRMAQGISTAYSKMSQAEQTLLRYNYLLSVTADAQGDFARTSDSWANQTRILIEQFNALKAEIGQGLIAALTPVVKALNIVINKLRVAAGYFRAFMELIFGKQSSSGGSGMAEVAEGTDSIADSAESASDAVGGIGDAASGAGKSAKKAAKEAKGALASFDELNQLKIADSSGSGDSGGGGGLENMGGAVEVDLGESTEETDKLSSMFDGVLNQLAKMKDLFGQGFTIGFASADLGALEKAIQSVKDGFKQIFEDGTIINAFTNMLDSFALNAGKVAGAFASIGVTIATNLIGGVGKYLTQNSKYIKDRLVGIFDASGDIAKLSGDYATAFADIFSVLGNEDGQQITANIIGVFSNAFLGATELSLKLGREIIECIVQPIIENKGKIKLALENTLSVFSEMTGTVKDAVTHLFEQAISVYDEYIGPALEKVKNGVSQVLEAILDAYNIYIAPMLQTWATEFQALYEQSIKPIVDQVLEIVGKLIDLVGELWENIIAPLAAYLINVLGPGVTAVLDSIWTVAKKVIEWICDVLGDLLTILEGIIDFLTGVFTGDWNKAWEGIQEIVVGAGDFIYNSTIGAIEKIVDAIWNVLMIAWEGYVEMLKNLFTPIVEWFNTNVIIPLCDFFSELWANITQFSNDCWNNITIGWQVASSWFDTTVIQPIISFFTTCWNTIVQLGTTCWNGIVSAWQGACNWFNTTIITPITTAFTSWGTNIKTIATTAWTNVKSAWNSATSWFNNTIINPIKTGFSTAWGNIKQKGIGAFNSIKDGCRSAINGIIGFINGLINKINSIGFDMPDALGGGHVGFNIPNIPRLARGGIVDKPTIAEIGEAGKEMVVPLENTSFVDKLASSLGNAVMSAMSTSLGTGGSGSGQNVSLEMDGTVFARSMTPYIMKEMRRLGFDF